MNRAELTKVSFIAMSELRIKQIRALTPQAKGRVERWWQTFQDRLLIELRIRRVSTLLDANAVIDELVHRHNERFAKAPTDSASAYRTLPNAPALEHILCHRETRVVTPANRVTGRNHVSPASRHRNLAMPLPSTIFALLTW
ncbi:MAG: hypothetical protein ACYCYO_16890 [Bacilli bacterium]